MTVWRKITFVERSSAGTFVRRTELMFPTTGAEVQGTLISVGSIDGQAGNAQRGRSVQLHSTSRLAGAITRMGSVMIAGNDLSAITQLGLPVYVIPKVGQSNEVGHGVLAEYPVPFPAASVASRIWMLAYSEDILPGAEPANITTNNLYTQYADAGTLGSPLIQIDETLALADANHVYMSVSCCFGGTTSTDWLVNDAITSLYGGISYRTRAVCEQLEAAGCDVTIPFMFLGQGESNGQSAPLAAAWATDWGGNLDQLELDFAPYLPSAGLRTIFAQVCPTVMPGLGPPYTQALWDALRANQATLQSSKRFMTTKPDGPLVGDGIHLAWGQSTSQGLYKEGRDAGLMAIAQGLI